MPAKWAGPLIKGLARRGEARQDYQVGIRESEKSWRATDRVGRAWTRGLRERVMGASRQCQQHIPLNQKQQHPCTIPHTRRREVQGRVRHFGSGVCEKVGVGPWTSCCMNAEEKGSDDLTAGIVYVDRWPASSTQTVLRPSTSLDLGRDNQTDGSFARRAEPGQVQPDRKAGTTASIAHIFCLDARYQPVTTVLNRRDELMKHQIILRALHVVPVNFQNSGDITRLWVSVNR